MEQDTKEMQETPLDNEQITDADETAKAVNPEGAEAAGETGTENTTGETDSEETADDSVSAESEKESRQERKKRKKEEKKDKRDEQIAELTDQVLRQRAEFVNFRTRTEKEKSQMFEVGAKSAFEKILPVIDNFERGLATLSEEEKQQPFAMGIEKTYKQLMTALEDAGVKAIEAVGQEFNPDFHSAVMHVEDETVGDNIVVEEFQKGYMYHDTVLRFSMVKVAN